jgi:hypothetical protein
MAEFTALVSGDERGRIRLLYPKQAYMLTMLALPLIGHYLSRRGLCLCGLTRCSAGAFEYIHPPI